MSNPPDSHSIARNNAGFSADELLGWHKQLESLAHELAEAESAAGSTADAVELDQSKVGRLSRMDALQMQAMARAEADRRSAHSQRVTLALSRVSAGLEGDYGLCRACEEPVDPKRLAVDPAALLCFDCASSK